MRADVRNRKGTQGSAFLDFLQKNALKIAIGIGLLIALLYAIPFIKQLIDRIKVKNEQTATNTAVLINDAQNASNSPTTQLKKTAAIKKKYPLISDVKMKEISGAAQAVAVALGKDVDSYRPLFGLSFLPKVQGSNYTEDEKAAISVLKKYPGTYPILADLYYNVHTMSQNLTKDLLELLSTKQVQELRDHYKKYGYKHF